MSDRLVTRACEIQKQKMTALLKREVEQRQDSEVVDLSKLFPAREDRERAEQSF